MLSEIVYGAVFAYFLGSLPAGYIAGRIAGVDIRTVGSRNVGATNVARVLGKRFGYPVFVVDFAKGFISVWLGVTIAKVAGSNIAIVDLCAATAAVFAVIGHSYPLWLRFKGGKGVATSMGALFAMNWIAAIAICLVWITIFQTTRYVSIASLGAAAALPIAMATMFLLNQLQTPIFVYFALALGAIVIWRHRSNISRLWDGTEPRFNRQ